jgi:two-component system nitrate/nitrite response regulator NarL
VQPETISDVPKDEVSSGEPLRAIIADDDPFVRRLVKEALRAAGIVVIADAGTGKQAVELTKFYRPDVVLMDVVMPELDGIDATRQILADRPEQRVILLTGSDDDEMALLGLRAGAVGFLTKDSVEALPRALQAVANGEAAVSRGLTKTLVDYVQSLPTPRPGMRPVQSPLTNREWEVIDLLQEEQSTAEIAAALFVSHSTARSHVKSILRKLGVHSRKEAVVVATEIREGKR